MISETAGYADMEQTLLTMNYRLGSRVLDAVRGSGRGAPEKSVYEGFEDLLEPAAVKRISGMRDASRRDRRIFHALLGHCLQYGSLPYENELSMWMRGAVAEVAGERIYLKDIHNWCQKRSDVAKRRVMERETSSLSKFLKPFALSVWEYVLDLIENEFEYEDYVAYCRDKKDVDYPAYASTIAETLRANERLYFGAMEDWIRSSLGISISEANRFDGIYLVGLGELDGLFPNHTHLGDHLGFFDHWKIDVPNLPGLHLHSEFSEAKGSQGVTFVLKIPREVHVVLNPQGGWIDLETLFHEIGHALFALFTSPTLSPPEKDFNTSNTLSETFAFLIQNMCFAPCFLERQLGLKPTEIDTITHYKALKDMAFFRRYAAKFLAEYRMYGSKAMKDGDIYASILHEHTGFSYKPETQLFDLAPELYSLDYVMAWMAEASVERFLGANLGDEWMFKREAGEILKEWWKAGNSYELDEFLSREGIGVISSTDLENRWSALVR
jgi:hypothetical protein